MTERQEVTLTEDQIQFLNNRTAEKVLEWFDRTIKNYESGIRDLKDYRERFRESYGETPKDKIKVSPQDVLGWAVNEINNINSNNRIDIAMRFSADLGALTYFNQQLEYQKKKAESF